MHDTAGTHRKLKSSAAVDHKNVFGAKPAGFKLIFIHSHGEKCLWKDTVELAKRGDTQRKEGNRYLRNIRY